MQETAFLYTELCAHSERPKDYSDSKPIHFVPNDIFRLGAPILCLFNTGLFPSGIWGVCILLAPGTRLRNSIGVYSVV